MRPPEVIAHRAGPAPSPENTLAALERAIAQGADIAEIDVQRTRDGVIVVVHDADLMRVAGDPRSIRQVDYASIQGLVQKPDDGSPASERRVATLAEFIERARGRIGLSIELKYYGPEPGLAPAVVREVRRLEAIDEVAIMSLDFAAVEQVRAMDPAIQVGYVMAAGVGDPTRLEVDFLALPRARISPRVLRLARSRDMAVHAWTINRSADMAELMEHGVDGLITDDPGLALRVRREMVALPTAGRLLLRFREVIPDEAEPTAEPATGPG